MDNPAVMMDLEAFPESCTANVIGLTTPQDACRLSLVSRHFKSAADSYAVWDKFLPAEINEILLHSESATDAKSKKEHFLTLSDTPSILIDGGKMVSYLRLARKEIFRYTRFRNESRADGWLEMELCEFHCQGDEGGELGMVCCKIGNTAMQVLCVQGIEIRPKMKYFEAATAKGEYR